MVIKKTYIKSIKKKHTNFKIDVKKNTNLKIDVKKNIDKLVKKLESFKNDLENNKLVKRKINKLKIN